MDFFEAVEKRYSHKDKFLPNAVPVEHLELIAKAGLAAPTGSNSQCVRLVILPDRELLEQFSQMITNNALATAPAAIAILTDSTPQGDMLIFELEDYSAAIQSMSLAATALGYVSLWLDYPFTKEPIQKAALKALGAPENCYLHAVLPVGLPDGPGSRREKLPYEARVSYRRFGGKKG